MASSSTAQPSPDYTDDDKRHGRRLAEIIHEFVEEQRTNPFRLTFSASAQALGYHVLMGADDLIPGDSATKVFVEIVREFVAEVRSNSDPPITDTIEHLAYDDLAYHSGDAASLEKLREHLAERVSAVEKAQHFLHTEHRRTDKHFKIMKAFQPEIRLLTPKKVRVLRRKKQKERDELMGADGREMRKAMKVSKLEKLKELRRERKGRERKELKRKLEKLRDLTRKRQRKRKPKEEANADNEA